MAKTEIFKVLGCGDIIQTPSQKSEGGFINKRFIRLQEFGGSNRQDSVDKASNAIVATMLGSIAQSVFNPGDLVLVSYRTSIREYQGSWYQDTTISDITKLKSSTY